VALYHFATKIMNYAELPLHALSQVIYPRITASFRTADMQKLKTEYALSVIRLMVFVVPITIVLMILSKQVVYLLADEAYINAAPLIIILSLGMIFKPFGRVFGLTLDAMGKPGINFYMLLASFAINITMNLVLIPKFGVAGAAAATSLSIFITIMVGQVTIAKHTPIRPPKDILHAIKLQFQLRRQFKKQMKEQPTIKKELTFN